MSRDPHERLRDILDAVQAIESHVGGSLHEPELAPEVALHAVLFNLMVIGEAAKHVDAELRRRAPEVRWEDMAGLRDIISHQYFRIRTQMIQDTVRRELPELKASLERLLAS